jgi:hypothetical protein
METSQDDQGPPSTSSSSGLPAAGWYPDPENPSRSRYWSGTDWTSWHRRGPGTPPPPPQYRPLGTLARVVIVLLSVYFVVTAIGLVSDWLELELANRLVEDQAAVTPAEMEASDARQGLIGILQVLIYVATGIMFIIWFRRAYRNLEAWGTEGLRFEAGWTVGGWLVPVLNLVRPKQIMNDLWRATDPELPVQPGVAWKQVRVPLMVHAWWLLFLLSLAVGIVASNFREASTLQQIRGASVVTLLSDVLILPAAVLACLVVNQITQRQRGHADKARYFLVSSESRRVRAEEEDA